MLSHFLRAASNNTGITLVGYSFAQRSSSGTSLVIDKPSGTQSGDQMIFIGIVAGNLTWTQLTGWTEKIDSNGRNLQEKTATGSEPDTYTFVVSSPLEIPSGYILTYRNGVQDAEGAVSALAQNPTAPSIEVEANSLVLLVASAAGVTSLYTTPSGWDLVANDTSTAPTSAIFSKTFTSSGDTGSVTVSGSATGTTSRAFLTSIAPI